MRLTPFATLPMAALTVAGLGTALGPPARADAAVTCTPVKIIAVPGTGETSPHADPDTPVGMLKGVTDPLKRRFGDRISAYYVPYLSTAFTQGITYADSERDGVRAMRAAMTGIARSCPGTTFVGVGYSQGADVNGDVAAQIGAGRGPVPAGRFIAGGNVSDPQQGTRGAVNLGRRQPGTQGLLGPRGGGYRAVAGRMATVCLKGDMYCATPYKDHLVRVAGAVGGHIGISGIAEIKPPKGTSAGVAREVRHPRAIIAEGEAVYVFYSSNVHVKYGTEPVDGTGRPAVRTLADWLAGRIA